MINLTGIYSDCVAAPIDRDSSYRPRSTTAHRLFCPFSELRLLSSSEKEAVITEFTLFIEVNFAKRKILVDLMQNGQVAI